MPAGGDGEGKDRGDLGPLPGGHHGLAAEQVAESQRERLLAAVATLVAERGYAGTTITEIAKTASVSNRVFYMDEGAIYEEVTYEGYGPGGAAIIIEATTDNANRTVAEVRHAFSRNGGNLGATNSVAWMFDRKGQIYIDAARHDEDSTLEAALEAGAEDFAREGEQYLVSTTPNGFHAVQDALKAKRFAVESAELAMVPKSTVKVEGKQAEQMLRLMETLEELDDVSKVFSNFDIDATAMAEAEASA